MTVSNFKIAKLNKQEAEQLCQNYRGQPHFNDLTNFLASDLVLAIEILAENAVNKAKDLAQQIRQKYGTDSLKSAVIASDSASTAAKDL